MGRKADAHIHLTIETASLAHPETHSATYQELQDYIEAQTGLQLSTLYIAQVKQKYGLIERDCYNHGEGKSRTPQCPPEKGSAITEALKHFGMI